MSTPSLQTFITDASQVLNLSSISAVRSVVAVALANANAGTPLNPNLTTQQLWNEFYQVVTEPKSNIESFIANQMMKFFFSPPAPGGVASNHEVIYNDNGVLAGDPKFLWDDALNKLDIDGSATISGDLTVDTTTLVVDATNDRVGIGTATPVARLIVRDGANRNLLVASDASHLGSTGIAIGSFTDNAADWAPLSLVAKTSIAFGLNGSTAMTLNATGNLAFPTGKGIDFSAVTGGTGTATANVLNDYEEGTWTIGLQFGGASTGMTKNADAGKYTKIGNQVTVTGYLALSNKGSATGNALIMGLPFLVNSYGGLSMYMERVSFADVPTGYSNSGTFTIPLRESTNAGVSSNLTDADFVNNSEIIFTMTYTV